MGNVAIKSHRKGRKIKKVAAVPPSTVNDAVKRINTALDALAIPIAVYRNLDKEFRKLEDFIYSERVDRKCEVWARGRIREIDAAYLKLSAALDKIDKRIRIN